MRILLLLALLASTGACQPPDLTFASVPWGSEPGEVRRMMTERGFDFLSVVNDRGDHLYAGSFAGRRAVIVARMAAGSLAKFEIGVRPAEGDERRALFLSLEETLAAEYGKERGTERLGDGAGATGWRDDAAPRRMSAWSRATPAGESFLILEDRPELAIVVSFESPAWHPEFERRQRR